MPIEKTNNTSHRIQVVARKTGLTPDVPRVWEKPASCFRTDPGTDRGGPRLPRSSSVRAGISWLFVPVLLLAVLTGPAFAEQRHRFAAELEVGPLWQSRNDVQIPNDPSATRFSPIELAGNGPWPAGRFTLTWNIQGRHGVRLLLAPLAVTETGTFEDEVRFAGSTFEPGVATRGTYRFNSWRITYRYRFHDGQRWRWWVGITAKVRDAKIRLEQGRTAAEDTDVGFVPLLYLRGDWRFADRWHLIFDLDAIGGGPGRAEDLSIKISRDIGERWSIAGGYRTLEGGADVDAVYNFAWLNYAVISAVYRF